MVDNSLMLTKLELIERPYVFKIMIGLQQQIEELLERIDIRINGDRPWDIQVHNSSLFQRVVRQGSVGLGEAYMDRWWDCEALDEFFTRILNVDLEKKVALTLPGIFGYLKSVIRNPQTQHRSYDVGRQHYDIGNDLYEKMLDRRMVYTCGFWDGAGNLDEAQEHKLAQVCRRLKLEPGQRILDIGCGWGSFAQYAAEEYSVEVVGVTVSKEQQKLASKRCQSLPVEVRLQDYRDVDERFDGIVSLGMLEHVGSKNYRTYMRMANRCLKKGGRFVLHSIGGNKSVHTTDPWIAKYIFPNSMIPSIRQLGLSMEGLFIMEDWKNHGPEYDQTLMAWYRNFIENWDLLKKHYSERFFRMWKYYLLCSAGSFRARKNNQWEIVLSKHPLSDDS